MTEFLNCLVQCADPEIDLYCKVTPDGTKTINDIPDTARGRIILEYDPGLKGNSRMSPGPAVCGTRTAALRPWVMGNPQPACNDSWEAIAMLDDDDAISMASLRTRQGSGLIAACRPANASKQGPASSIFSPTTF